MDELVSHPKLDFSPTLLSRLEELKEKHKCIQYTPKKEEEKNFDLIEDAKKQKLNFEEEEDGWDNINDVTFDEEEVRIQKPSSGGRISPINEGVRNRRRVGDPEQDQIRDSYERWKDEQGAQFAEQFQQQTAIIKEEFVKADRDDEIEKLEQQIAEITSLSSVFSEKVCLSFFIGKHAIHAVVSQLTLCTI